MEKEIISFKPTLRTEHARQFTVFFKDLANKLQGKNEVEQDEILGVVREEIRRKHNRGKIHANHELLFAESLLLDMLVQGWKIVDVENKELEYEELSESNLSPLERKAVIRKRQLYSRNDQLKQDSVIDFVRDMEKRRLTPKGWHSIFSLMRDGKELHDALKSIQGSSDDERTNQLSDIIKPYIQFVEPDVKCEHTGFLLSDIWRYFRHTWITEYSSLPGRSTFILIRDAAALSHPVIGIAALGSSVAQQTCRDKWIGWEGDAFLEKLKQEPSGKYGKWIIDTLDSLIKELYLKDFLDKGIVTRNDLKKPTLEKIKALRSLSSNFKKLHIEKPHTAKFTVGNEEMSWEDRARTNLFKSKRSLILSELLLIRSIFQKHNFKTGSKKELISCLGNKECLEAIGKLIRKQKSIHVGINMMDIIVCGSIAPYNHILGGKLVCMMLTSPEVVQHYNNKYSESVSLIASSMRGKPVIRKPNLVFLGTTSLFGVGSSQYNRIKIPTEQVGSDVGLVEYKELGVSEGFGVFHFSSNTKKLADILVGKNTGGKKVNSIFGEGANPLMRKLRDSLQILQLQSESILNHRSRRVVYGVALAKNFFEVLIGLQSRVQYVFNQTKPRMTSELIAKFWIKRWLSNRVLNNEIMEQVKAHTLSYPVTHGARVPLEVKERVPSLFE